MACITNSTHDISLAGLRFCPDLDAACQIVNTHGRETGQGIHVLRRAGLIPTGEWDWLDDVTVAQAVTRSYRLARGATLAEAAARQLDDATGGPSRVLPLTDEPIELHAVEPDGDGGRMSRHALRWIEDPSRREPESFVVAGVEGVGAAPGVLDALRSADAVLVPPMSPVLDMAGFLAVDGVRDALRGTSARVVALSPVGLEHGYPEEVDAASWRLTGAAHASTALADLYGDFVDVLVIDEAEAPARYPSSLTVTRAPLRAALTGDAEAAARLRAVVLG